jgi:hypothetical protein
LDEVIGDGCGDNDDKEGGGGEENGQEVREPGLARADAADVRSRGLHSVGGGRERDRERKHE